MPSSLTQRSFAAGELSPSLYARADQVKYVTGLKTCKNFLVMRHGGVTNRQGSGLISEVKDSSVRTYLLDFIFNAEQTYLLEFGAGYIRFYREAAQLVVSGVAAWLEDTSYAQGDLASNGGTNYYCIADHVSSLSGAPAAWADATLYDPGDLVSNGGSNYRCLVLHTSIDVSSAGDWVDLTPYSINDLVTNGDQVFRALSNHTSSADDEPGVGVNWPTFWEPIDANEPGVGSAWESYWELIPASDNEPGVGADWEDFWYALTGAIYEIPTPYAADELSELRTSQSGDVVTLTHRNHPVMELRRTGHTSWTLVTQVRAPSLAAPANVTNSGAVGSITFWVVTAVDEFGEESVQSTATSSSAVPSSGSPITVFWSAVTGASLYRIYKRLNGLYGFIGEAGGTSFQDTGIAPDLDFRPFVNRDPFATAGNYPALSARYKQRLLLANTDNAPELIEASVVGSPNNFTRSVPLADDDAVSFEIAGNQVQEVRHLIPLKRLLVLTAGGEWTISGDGNGAFTPSAINPDQDGYVGASTVPPAVVGNTCIYVQARGSMVRDLRWNSVDGYEGKDLSIFATHLFTGKTLERMAFSQNPHSVVYVVRSDGVLLGLTYLPEHEVWGWHRQETQGLYEDVRVLPEGEEDAVYVIVNRTIGGVTKRYIERFARRRIDDIKEDCKFLDSFLTYDGRNTAATTMTLSSVGGGWTVTDEITVARSVSGFSADDVGNAVVFLDADGDETLRIEVTSFVSGTVVRGYPSKDVPVSLRSVATTSWALAVDQFSGLDHLEGEILSVFGDGNVVFNGDPDDERAADFTVASGMLTLGAAFFLLHAGLPYTSEIQTLPMDREGLEIRDKKKKLTGVTLLIEDSRGGKVGADEDNLGDLDVTPPENYDNPLELETGTSERNIADTWNETGSVIVRQSDPLPLTVLAAIPHGDIGG